MGAVITATLGSVTLVVALFLSFAAGACKDEKTSASLAWAGVILGAIAILLLLVRT